jgi:hypothetical protein
MNNFSNFFSEYVQNNPPKDNLISEEYIKKFLGEFDSRKNIINN